jgi:putative drug exporter of the RND superfamily
MTDGEMSLRIVLVPATMKLSGDWNWWVPRWLGRVLPRFDIQGGVGLRPSTSPAAAMPAATAAKPSPCRRADGADWSGGQQPD